MLSPVIALASIFTASAMGAKTFMRKVPTEQVGCGNQVYYPDKSFFDYDVVTTFYCGNLAQSSNISNRNDCYRIGYVPHETKHGILVSRQTLNLSCNESQTIENECRIECPKKKRCHDDDECNCSKGCCYKCNLCKLPCCPRGDPLLLTFDSCLLLDADTLPECPDPEGLSMDTFPYYGIYWDNAYLLNIPLSIGALASTPAVVLFLNALVSKNNVVANFNFTVAPPAIGPPAPYIHLIGDKRISLISLYFNAFPDTPPVPGTTAQIHMSFTPLDNNGQISAPPCVVAMSVELNRKPTLVIFGEDFKNIWGVSISGSHIESGNPTLVRFTLDNILLCSEWVPPPGYTP